MATSLEKLPTELLSQIVAHVPTAQTMLRLALTCRRLNNFIHSDGFRVFVQNRFPSLETPPCWRDAAHALTTLSRNWDRKAFIAHFIDPPKPQPLDDPHSYRARRPQRPQQQTIGYQPVIDSYEVWDGGHWDSRKEVVVWGAGAELVLRSKRMGELAEKEWHSQESEQRQSVFDQHHHMHDWFSLKMAGTADGRDDITSANFIPSHDKDPEHIFVGRASGMLHHVSISVQDSTSTLVGTYVTKGRPVRSATVSADPQPLLAACLADNAVALYSTSAKGNKIDPVHEVAAVPPGAPGRTWSTKFLRNDRLAIGRGPSGQPILVYGVGQNGLSSAPLRRFEVLPDSSEVMDLHASASRSRRTSIYPIAPIAPSSAAGGAEGDIFLSGGYDGNVRLHDLRSPASSTAQYDDIVDSCAIYSLLAFGRERFIAGASRGGVLQVFDLRMCGGKVYQYIDAVFPSTSGTMSPSGFGTQANKKQVSSQSCGSQIAYPKTGYNLFLDPLGGRRPTRYKDSPVYSLSAPSPYSPSIYAGVENAVIQLDVVSALDRHPDPVFGKGLRNDGGLFTSVEKFDPNRDAICLRMYERTGGNLDLKAQVPLGSARSVLQPPTHREEDDDVRYLDERWYSTRN